VTAGCALLGTAAHIANVLPDLDDDVGTGVRGFVPRIGEPAARTLLAGLLLAAVALTVLAPPGPAAWWGWVGLAITAASAGWLWRRRTVPRDQTGFAVSVAVAALALGLLGLTLAGG
jgi:1,4-dihydroxy-2-naphthoate octaprenyltransferase